MCLCFYIDSFYMVSSRTFGLENINGNVYICFPVSWLILTEIFPVGVKGRAVAAATVFNWGTNILISMTFLEVIGLFRNRTDNAFCTKMTAFSSLWVAVIKFVLSHRYISCWTELPITQLIFVFIEISIKEILLFL